MQWREQCQCPLMLVDSEPQDEYDHSLNWVMVGNAKQEQSEMGKCPPMSGGMTMPVSLPDAEYFHPPEEGPSLPIGGWLHTLPSKCRKTKISQETRMDSQSTRMCSPRRKEGTVG